MKLSKILLILILAATVVSCNKKDDDGDSSFDLNNENLAGTYELVFYESVTTETTDVNGLEVVSVISNIGDTFQVDYIFESDGDYTADGLFRIVSTTVVNGETTSEDAYIETVEITNGSFSTTTSTSLLILDGKTYEVDLFNETEVRIRFEETQTFQNGDTEIYVEELRFLRK